jgi:hypothetical protein
VLDPGEKVWAEVPVNLDWTPLVKPGQQAQPAVRS